MCMKIKTLEKSRATAVFLALLDSPQKNFSELLSEVGGSATTVKMRVDEFIKEGLVQEREQESFPFRRGLTLTDKGLNVAKMLKALKGVSVEVEEKSKSLTNKEKWILALLHALGGEVRGTTRLQKLFFLLKKETGIVEREFFEFTPMHFGPYSADLMQDVKGLQKIGFITISEEVFEPKELSEDWIIRRTYELTFKGEKEGREAYNDLPEAAKQALISLRQYKKMLLTKLLQYVHSKYPQYCVEREDLH